MTNKELQALIERDRLEKQLAQQTGVLPTLEFPSAEQKMKENALQKLKSPSESVTRPEEIDLIKDRKPASVEENEDEELDRLANAFTSIYPSESAERKAKDLKQMDPERFQKLRSMIERKLK